MAKKYVATIMNRISLGDNNFIFLYSHPAIGTYDDKTKIFKDRNGMEYLPLTDPHMMQSEVSTAYANIEEMYKIPNKVGQTDMTEAISDYAYYCSRFIYYVSKTETGLPFCIPMDYIQLKENLDKKVKIINDNGELERASNEGLQIKDGAVVRISPNPEQAVEPIKQDKKETSAQTKEPEKKEKKPEPPKKEPFEEVLAKEVFNKDVRSDIAAFFMELMEDIYSVDELKAIRSNIELQMGDLDTLLESLDAKIAEMEEKLGLTPQEVTPEEKKQASVEEIKKKIKHYLNLVEIYQKVTKTLVAQDEPTRRVLAEIARKEQMPEYKNRGILITGQTGCGKTKMMDLIAKYIDKPFIKVDATKLTIPGYTGTDIEEVLWDLYVKCGKDIEKTQKAIIFFDEIDKKGSAKKDDVSGRGVLNTLLPFIEGTVYNACENTRTQKNVVKIDTTDMITLLGGAFEDVYGFLANHHGMGFGASRETDEERKKKATTKDFIEKAQIPGELLGRVAIVKLNDLDVKAIKRILLESDESAILLQQKLFEQLGVKLTFADDFLEEVAEQAVKRSTGARGLNTIVDESTWEAYADAYSNLGEYEEIIIGKEALEDPKQYVKVQKKESV